MKLEDACRHYLTQHKPKPHTYRAYEQTTRRLIRFLGAGRPLHLITEVDLLDFAADLSEEDIAPATIYKHKKNTKIIFKWFTQEAKWIDQNPSHLIKLRRVSSFVREEKALADKDLEILLDYARFHPMLRALILFVTDTGCRVGGAATLTRKNLDLKERMAYVTEKGDKTRRVWFGEECARALSQWIISRPTNLDHDYIFYHSKGPYNPPSLSQMFRRTCIKLGLKSQGLHSARHRKGHQLANEGVPVTIAAQVLGHESFMTTLEYYYPHNIEEVEKAMRDLAATGNPQKLDNVVEFKRRGSS